MLVAAFCVAAPGLHANTAKDHDIAFLVGNISDLETRTLIAASLAQNSTEFDGLPGRVGIQLPAGTSAKSEAQAWEHARNIILNIERIASATKAIAPPSTRHKAEKDLARLLGLIPSREEEDQNSAWALLKLHHRELSREVFPLGHFRFWSNAVTKVSDTHEAERIIGELFTNTDIPWIADLLCNQLNEYAIAAQYGTAGKASVDRGANILAHTLCISLGTKFKAPFGGWGSSRLKRYAIKQLRRAAKRPDLAPADAEAIATALHQLETFQPDPMNAVRL